MVAVYPYWDIGVLLGLTLALAIPMDARLHA